MELYRSARGSPPPEFHERALALLEPVLGFDSALWGSASMPDSGLTFEAVQTHNLLREMFQSYGETKSIDPVSRDAWRCVEFVCSFNLSELARGRKCAVAAAIDSRWELRNMVVDPVRNRGTGNTKFVSLYRTSHRSRYSAEEGHLGETLLPHFLEAGTINLEFWVNRIAGTSTAGRRAGRAIANRYGALCADDGRFSDLLRQEWPQWAPPILPRSLLESIRRSPTCRFGGVHITVDVSMAHGLICLHAEEKSAAECLTAAEFAAATRVACGHSYKQVAKELSLSPATVRNQLHSAYAKLGIPNKTALARLLDGQQVGSPREGGAVDWGIAANLTKCCCDGGPVSRSRSSGGSGSAAPTHR